MGNNRWNAKYVNNRSTNDEMIAISGITQDLSDLRSILILNSL